MISVIATNITSPIGLSTEENYQNVKNGKSAISTLRDWNGIPGLASVGVFDEQLRQSLLIDGFTWYESLIIRSIREASEHVQIDFSSPRLGLIISTTKGNIECLDGTNVTTTAYSTPGKSAKKVAVHLGITTEPVVVCNACISGITAQVLADRYITAGIFDTVIVCGADTVNRFCLAGFTSFKALSPYPCRPFDVNRLGFNIGECASTIILSKTPDASPESWRIVSSHLDNDAYHVSAPSPNGEGVKRAIDRVLFGNVVNDIAFICAHGTATMFNDQMESKAIEAAGLSQVPVSAFKGVFGHTLGAAGVIEPVLAMRSLSDGVILPVRGYEELGVSGKVTICEKEKRTDSKSFLKVISGFGGCNGAVVYSHGLPEVWNCNRARMTEIVGTVRIIPDRAEIDGINITASSRGSMLVTELYKGRLADNPRFYKMDLFSRLAYVAIGMLLSGRTCNYPPEDISMILFNNSSSIVADMRHIENITGPENFYPSPAVFINTLPNVVMGEIAVKYNIKGETTFVVLDGRNDGVIDIIIDCSTRDHPNSLMVTGWVDLCSEDNFEAELKLMKIQ